MLEIATKVRMFVAIEFIVFVAEKDKTTIERIQFLFNVTVAWYYNIMIKSFLPNTMHIFLQPQLP